MSPSDDRNHRWQQRPPAHDANDSLALADAIMRVVRAAEDLFIAGDLADDRIGWMNPDVITRATSLRAAISDLQAIRVARLELHQQKQDRGE